MRLPLLSVSQRQRQPYVTILLSDCCYYCQLIAITMRDAIIIRYRHYAFTPRCRCLLLSFRFIAAEAAKHKACH